MPEQLHVKGHGLRWEGNCVDKYGFWLAVGPASCTCGWRSEDLTSNGQRKRAHRQHKLDVLADQNDGLLCD